MIYFDNASTTKIDPRVLEAMMPYLTESYGNAGTLYKIGRDAAIAISEARKQVADLVGAKPEQIVFTSGGSEANNMVFAGLKAHLLSAGRTHIVTTAIEHDSILNTVKEMCKSQYIVDGKCTKPLFDATYIPPMDNWGVHPDVVIDCVDELLAIGKDVGIVSVMHTNNETGLENIGLSRIAQECHAMGVLFHTDCVQAVGCSHLDVEEIGCDFMSLSSHKIHGGKGVGALYIRDKSIMSPLIFGGTSQEFGLRGGTENVASIVGFGKACEILQLQQNKDRQYIIELLNMLYDNIKQHLSECGLEHILHINGGDNLSLHGKTVNLRFDNVDGETLLLLLDAKGMCASAGSACRSHESEPSHVLTAMGISKEDARNSVRFSLSRMNTVDEILSAAKIIAECVEMLYQKS